MKILEIDFPNFKFAVDNNQFDVVVRYLDKSIIIEPLIGWELLSVLLHRDPETLHQDVNDLIYNAYPEAFDYERE